MQHITSTPIPLTGVFFHFCWFQDDPEDSILSPFRPPFPKPRPLVLFFYPSRYCSGRESWQQNKQLWQSVSRQPRCCQASVAAFVFERSELHCCVGCSLVHPKSDVRYGCPWRFIIKALIRPRLKHRIWNGWSKSFDVGETATQSQKYLSFSSQRRGMFYYFLSTFFSSCSCPFLFHVSVHAGFGCLASLFM